MVDNKLELDKEEWRDVFLSAIENAKSKNKWVKDAKEAMGTFRCERDDELTVYYPTLANVVDIQQSAIITKAPEVVVTGNNELTYNDDIKAQIASKVISHFIDENCLDEEIDKFAASCFAASNGAIRINDDLTFRMVNHENMILEPCAEYAQLDWVAFRHNISKGVYIDKWGSPTASEYQDIETTKGFEVYEVWDKKNKLVWWISAANDETLECGEPAIKYPGFYPIARPYMFKCKTNMYQPTVEYNRWKHLDKLIQAYAQREKVISEAIKAGYFYDEAAFGDLVQIEFTSEQQGIPVSTPEQYLDAAGQFDINKAISYWDNMPATQVLTVLETRRKTLIEEVNRITGISNEMQSFSDHRETATAAKIKQGWGSGRTEDKRRPIHRHIRDTLRLYWAAINHVVGVDEMIKISGVEAHEQVILEMNSGALFNYDIDIETQTTIAINEKDERSERLESLNALSSVLERMSPLVDSGKMTMDIVIEFMKMVTKSYPQSQTINDELDTLPQNYNTVQQLNGQVGQLTQQLQQTQQSLMQMEQEKLALEAALNNTTQIDLAKTVAETKKIEAEAHVKVADTVKKEMEAAQIGSQQTITPDGMMDEQAAYQNIRFNQ